MKPKNYNIKFTKQELNNFKEVISQGELHEEKFLEDCCNQYSNNQLLLNKEDIYSLFLIKAILITDYKIVEHILSKSYSINILTNYDSDDNSPIYTALMYQDIKMLEILKCYIENKYDIPKSELSESQIRSISDILALAPLAKTYFNDYIKQVYDTESVKMLEEMLGDGDIYDVY